MLTSYHYLLSGFTAAFLATGILHLTTIGSQRLRSGFSERVLPEAVDVSHRGSGRLGDSPSGDHREKKISLMAAHRGSGRIELNVS